LKVCSVRVPSLVRAVSWPWSMVSVTRVVLPAVVMSWAVTSPAVFTV
jgi:hypothetical protein